jgi:predicted nucleic acid-binding protein
VSRNVFFDTNVLLDVLACRQDHYRDSSQIWTLAEQGRIDGQVSVISFNNIYYVLRKQHGRQTAEHAVSRLRSIFTPIPLDAQVLNQAIDAHFEDLEDAIQYHSALRGAASFIVSRNPHHFPKTGILPVLSPAEFLAVHSGL